MTGDLTNYLLSLIVALLFVGLVTYIILNGEKKKEGPDKPLFYPIIFVSVLFAVVVFVVAWALRVALTLLF